jgi:hypothetical protein
MLFVSKYREYMFVVDAGRTRIAPAGPSSVMMEIEEAPMLIAQFSPGGLSPRILNAAFRKLYRTEGDFGAIMSTQSGVVDSAEPGIGGQPYDAADPRWRISGFNTDTQCPAEYKALYEEKLLEPGHGIGIDFDVLEALGHDKPWPSYDKAGQGAAAKIPAMTKELGLDPRMVIEYERHTKNREGVIKALTAMVDESVEQEQDEAPIMIVVD